MPGPELEPILRADGLGYRFQDGAWAFRGIDFRLREGEIAVLAGRNGAGKTLLAKTLAGLLRPTEGSVRVSGLDLGTRMARRAELVGYLFQDARLQVIGETLIDDALFGPTNLGVARAEAEARARAALGACGLADREGDFVHTLSGGELRRLAIAGLLAMLPKVVILDEPFANLDLSGVRAVLGIARSLASGGIAVLIVTHEIEKVLGLASRFSVMDEGRLTLSGEPSQVLEAGVESYGLRDPYRPLRSLEDLQWLE